MESVFGSVTPVTDNVSIDVVVLAYNHADFISDCLKGIWSQVVPSDWSVRVIIGEDGSTDGTREMIKEFLSVNERPDFSFVLLDAVPHNLKCRTNGAVNGWANLKRSLMLVTAEYCCYCEGDDFWDNPKKLITQVGYLLRNRQFSVVWAGVRIIDANNRVTSIETEDRVVALDDLVIKNLVGNRSCTAVWRSVDLDVARLIEFDFMPFADWLIWLFLLEKGNGHVLSPVLGSRRIHSDGAWSGLHALDKYAFTLSHLNLNVALFPEHCDLSQLHTTIRMLRRSAVVDSLWRDTARKFSTVVLRFSFFSPNR